MALKIFTIIMALFVAEITFLATKEPKKIKVEAKKELQADIVFTNLQGKMLDENGSKGELKASKATRYNDHEKLFDININFKDENLSNHLRAKEAIHKDGKMIFQKSVEYENNQSMKILSQNLVYDMKKKLISSNLPFHLLKDNATISGESFRYDTKNRKVEIEKVKYTQEVNR